MYSNIQGKNKPKTKKKQKENSDQETSARGLTANLFLVLLGGEEIPGDWPHSKSFRNLQAEGQLVVVLQMQPVRLIGLGIPYDLPSGPVPGEVVEVGAPLVLDTKPVPFVVHHMKDLVQETGQPFLSLAV